MNEEFKKKYWERYTRLKNKGVKFYPDVVYKDLVVSFALFLLLIGLATFVGVKPEPPVDPNDTSYIPRPEWYFLFLFEFLKFIPGELEWVGAVVIPGLAILVLLLLPFIDKNPYRHWSKRKVGTGIMTAVVVAMVGLTIRAVVTTPPQEERALALTLPEQIALGQELYSIHCAECHGPDGEGGEIQGVEGLEGVVLKPINSQDEMYTRSDQTLYNIIEYGQPDLGMPPFGRAYGGELGPAEIKAIVTFMRYTWDDRVELPKEAKVGAVPELGPNEVPSYDEHVEPLVKRYCISCHRPGKKNNNYIMTSYEEVMNTGDHAPVIIPGDPDNSILVKLIRGEKLDFSRPMPPNRRMPDEAIDIFVRWIAAGAPKTAEEADQIEAQMQGQGGAATPTPTP